MTISDKTATVIIIMLGLLVGQGIGSLVFPRSKPADVQRITDLENQVQQLEQALKLYRGGQ